MIFIDTGALLAKYLVRDQHHKKAIELFPATFSDCGHAVPPEK